MSFEEKEVGEILVNYKSQGKAPSKDGILDSIF
jgi:hypothetical protein